MNKLHLLVHSMFIYIILYSVRGLLSKQSDPGQCIRISQSNDLSYSLYSSYLVLVLPRTMNFPV